MQESIIIKKIWVNQNELIVLNLDCVHLDGME